MKIQIFVNSTQKATIDSSGYRAIRIGFITNSRDSYGELQLSATSQDFTTKFLESIRIISGDIITIGSKSGSGFTKEKIDLFKEVYDKSSTGKVCQSKLHLIIDNDKKSLVQANYSTSIALNYFWFLEKQKVEFSQGIVDEDGSEQWMTNYLSEDESIELLFLTR